MKLLNHISRIFIGLVFIFSGFVKALDPLGSTYKFHDYFDAFGMESLAILAFPLAILLSTLEFSIGLSLLCSTKRKLTVWLLSIFMGFFTILTFILAIYNPVSDCGCFGDALILTNWQTFGKNIILMIFVVILFITKDQFEVKWSDKKQWTIISIPILFSILFSVYCYKNLPIIDFRPYKIGTYIPEKMIIPENAPKAKYETRLVYQKDGIEKEFTLDNFPDSTWEWVSTNNELISEGYIPPIHDFTIGTLLGSDITEIILNDNKFTFLLIAHDIKKANVKNMQAINKLAKFAQKSGRSNFICMTSSSEDDINKFKEKTNAQFLFFNTDDITLKTIIRSNPGIVLLKKGTVLGKWHHRNAPTPDEFSKDFLENPKYKKENTSNEALALIN